MDPTCTLMELPLELLFEIVRHAMYCRSLVRALRLRLANRMYPSMNSSSV